MTEEPQPRHPESILLVEDDEFIARLLRGELARVGYEVRIASDGLEALGLAFERCPDLVLADVMMPNMDGYEMTRRLREDPRTEGVSIIMLTARGMAADRLEGLMAGADDYLVKPFDADELLARIAGVMRRAEYMRSASPLTGLPGNIRIEDEIESRIAHGLDFALMYLDLDNFKAYSDRYGFVRGDEALKATARVIRDTSKELGGTLTFVGHIGGDDFVVMTDPDVVRPIAEEIIRRFDELAPSLYDPEDVARGYVEAEDRQGNAQRFPLVSVSIGIATTVGRKFGHRAEMVQVATELKNYTKRTPGSSYVVDRRAAV